MFPPHFFTAAFCCFAFLLASLWSHCVGFPQPLVFFGGFFGCGARLAVALSRLFSVLMVAFFFFSFFCLSAWSHCLGLEHFGVDVVFLALRPSGSAYEIGLFSA